MTDPPPVLAVIPARAGSRGVPGKNLQLFGGVPLVLRTARTVVASGVCAQVFVSTNDPAVLALAAIHGLEVLERPEGLCGSDVGIQAVLAHAAQETGWEGLVAAFQPTCPLLSPGSIQKAVAAFRASGSPWGITAVPARHLIWNTGLPLTARRNRQVRKGGPQEEVGAMTIATTARLARSEPFGADGALLPLPDAEAVDIDTPGDLASARQADARRNILIEIAVGKQVGSGHFHRARRLAEGLAHHDVGVSIRGECPTWALEALDQRGLWWEGVESSFRGHLDLVILDVLDTTPRQVCGWKAEGVAVASFEDEGPGALYADLVVNELLTNRAQNRRALCGPRYTILRPEFAAAPNRPVHERGQRILISFGGTDPAGLNARVGSLLAGYETLTLAAPGGLDGPNMAEKMAGADLVFTSCGRTQYEAAALGIPAVTIAANERESRHYRCAGHLHLGLHAAVSDHAIQDAAQRLCSDPALRAEMAGTARAEVDGLGLDRVVWHLDGLLGGLA